MQLTLQSIPLTETLRYALGAKAPDPLPDALAASTKEACQALLPVCQPRYTYLVRPTQPLLEGLLSGDDIRRHLQGCEQCVLFGATLGPQADALIRRAQVDDMAKALWLDAAASAAIEEVCDDEVIREERDIDLFEAGLLDSMAAIELLVGIESEFGVEIAPTAVEREEMNTVNKIIYQVQIRYEGN